MDANSEYSTQKELDVNMTQNIQNRTSFLIEDILYRQKTEQDFQNVQEKSFENRLESHQSPFKPTQVKYDNDKLFQQPKPVEKRPEKSAYGYFQPNIVQSGINNCVQGFQPTESGYIQVMGALGAYLGTPYKSISDPYFLTQGKSFFLKIMFY